MAIGPIEMNGMVTRQQDFQQIKTAEDAKPMYDNMNYSHEVKKNADVAVRYVHDKDESKMEKDDSDNKHNSYSGDGGRNRNKDNDKEEGRVIKKNSASFDVKI